MKVSSHSDPTSQIVRVIIEVTEKEFAMGDPRSLLREALTEAAKDLATTYVEDNKMVILEKISPAAVANLAIADSAKLVRQQFIDPTPKEEKDALSPTN
jgi:hypothetical protein